jgi:hypothetical protein
MFAVKRARVQHSRAANIHAIDRRNRSGRRSRVETSNDAVVHRTITATRE